MYLPEREGSEGRGGSEGCGGSEGRGTFLSWGLCFGGEGSSEERRVPPRHVTDPVVSVRCAWAPG